MELSSYFVSARTNYRHHHHLVVVFQHDPARRQESTMGLVHLYQLLPRLGHEANFLYSSLALTRSPIQMATATGYCPLTCHIPPSAPDWSQAGGLAQCTSHRASAGACSQDLECMLQVAVDHSQLVVAGSSTGNILLSTRTEEAGRPRHHHRAH